MSNGRCRMHGGKSLRGVASLPFKHGRYSKQLSDRLAGRFSHHNWTPFAHSPVRVLHRLGRDTLHAEGQRFKSSIAHFLPK